jgi:hypothetical protein
MNVRAILTSKATNLTTVPRPNDGTPAAQCRSSVSRRQFARTLAGTAVAGTGVVGTALGSELQKPERAENRWSFAPVPIPGGSPGIGVGRQYHVFGPSPVAGGDPIDAEPATITALDGFVGLAYISGNVTQTNRKTGEQQLLPFADSDMRFMKGIFPCHGRADPSGRIRLRLN